MRVLVAGSLWPHTGHTIRAANVVIFELVRALAKQPGAQIGYLRIRRYGDTLQTEQEQAATCTLRECDVEVLDELVLPPPHPPRPAWRKLFNPRRADFYPDSIHASLASASILGFQPDVLLIPWSEWITALCADLPVIKFAYYGNPDHKVGLHRHAFDRRYGLSRYSKLRTALYLHHLEQVHLQVMQCYEMLGNVSANDAIYYQQHGHPNAFYVHNIWIDRFGPAWQTMRAKHEQHNPVKIIANVGQLGGTANRYGLELLGREVAPALRDALKGIPYEIHILGKGELDPPLVHLLDRPEIRLRGFVDDIDKELLESAVFLCLNNGSPFKVGHTRYLHAWSLGCCVIAYRDAALSMPELQHQRNAMLGKDAEEIAAYVRQVIDQPNVRLRLGLAGYKTFRDHFIAERVAEELWWRIHAYMDARQVVAIAGKQK